VDSQCKSGIERVHTHTCMLRSPRVFPSCTSDLYPPAPVGLDGDGGSETAGQALCVCVCVCLCAPPAQSCLCVNE